MKRVIKDFKTITPEVMALINDQYPYGYEDNQLVTFVNAKGEFVKALEVRTDEVVYLIKLDRKLDEHINDYMDSDGDADASADGDDTISFDSDTSSVDVEIEDTSDEEED